MKKLKVYKIIAIVFICFIFPSITLSHGTFLLEGKVFDLETNQPINNGRIQIFHEESGVLHSDEPIKNGKYHIISKLHNKYVIIVSAKGYHDNKLILKLPNQRKMNEIVELDFYLQRKK